MGVRAPHRIASAPFRAGLVFVLFLAEVALAGCLTGLPYDLGCTHGCHPGDAEFLPCLAALVAVAGGVHAACTRCRLVPLAARVVGVAAALVAVDLGLDLLRLESPVDWALFALVASLVWAAGAALARLAQRVTARPRGAG